MMSCIVCKIIYAKCDLSNKNWIRMKRCQKRIKQKTTSNRYFDMVSFRKQTKNRFSTHKQEKVISTEENEKKNNYLLIFFG